MTEPTSDPAKARFFWLQLTRLAGVLLAGVGVLMWRTDAVVGYPDPTTGTALRAAGLFRARVAPALLRRRWRTPG